MPPEVISFGCRLNLLDGDEVEAHARAAGFDGTIVNSCAVTQAAMRDARRAVRRAARTHPKKPIWVTGCAASLAPAEFAAMPQVERVLPNAAKHQPAAWGAPPRSTPPHQARARALVQVQTGCNHRCTFCIIPYARGAARSTPIAEVVRRVRELSARGHKEVVLTGVDVTSWGPDIGEAGLGALVRAILRAVPALPRLRLSSLDAVELDAEFLDMVMHEPRLMPHLHLSLQAGDDMILKRMKRRHSRADAVRFCARLKARRPALTFGADLIAGFPTETDAQHARSLALIEDCGLVWCHVFPFSPRPNTPAARMPQLAPPMVQARAAALRTEAARVRRAWLDAQIGSVKSVLVEEGGRARAEDFASIQLAAPAPPSQSLLSVRITERSGDVLVGTAA